VAESNARPATKSHIHSSETTCGQFGMVALSSKSAKVSNRELSVKSQKRLFIEQEQMRHRHTPAPEPVLRSVPPLAHQPIEQEQHFNTNQIAKMWAMSTWTVRRLFAGRPGVLKISLGDKKKANT
jgi:hypothetical protein